MEEQIQNSSDVLKIGKWEVNRKTVKTVVIVGVVSVVLVGVAALVYKNTHNVETVGELTESIGEAVAESIEL